MSVRQLDTLKLVFWVFTYELPRQGVDKTFKINHIHFRASQQGSNEQVKTH